VIEYVIWGIAPNTKKEQILLTAIKGSRIQDKDLADYWAKRLTDLYECTKVRIQELNLSDGFCNDFKKSINNG